MASKDPYRTQGSLSELRQFIQKFDTAMLVTLTPEHLIRARPMAIQDPGEVSGCDLWFITGDETGKVHEIVDDEQVGVCCLRNGDRAYLSISATAQVERDPALIKRLFKPSWRAWFDGPDDPSMVLLKLHVERAEYWEPEGGRLRVLFEMVKGVLGGEKADEALNPPKRI